MHHINSNIGIKYPQETLLKGITHHTPARPALCRNCTTIHDEMTEGTKFRSQNETSIGHLFPDGGSTVYGEERNPSALVVLQVSADSRLNMYRSSPSNRAHDPYMQHTAYVYDIYGIWHTYLGPGTWRFRNFGSFT
jgi:hypothetical protein